MKEKSQKVLIEGRRGLECRTIRKSSSKGYGLWSEIVSCVDAMSCVEFERESLARLDTPPAPTREGKRRDLRHRLQMIRFVLGRKEVTNRG